MQFRLLTLTIVQIIGTEVVRCRWREAAYSSLPARAAPRGAAAARSSALCGVYHSAPTRHVTDAERLMIRYLQQ